LLIQLHGFLLAEFSLSIVLREAERFCGEIVQHRFSVRYLRVGVWLFNGTKQSFVHRGNTTSIRARGHEPAWMNASRPLRTNLGLGKVCAFTSFGQQKQRFKRTCKNTTLVR